jgi:hypothetical protein
MCAMLGILGMVMQIGGAIAGGMAKKADAELQAEVARMNAGVAETTAQTNEVLAQLPQISAKLDTQKIKDALRIALGAQTATYSTANLDPASGAPLLIAGISVGQAQVDIGLTKAQADLSTAARMADAASGYAGAATERFKVVAAANEASNAMMSALFGAGSALIGGLQNLGLGGTTGMFGGGGGGAFAGSSSAGFIGPASVNMPLPTSRPLIVSASDYGGTRIIGSAYRTGASGQIVGGI